ncbi:MAG TPA: molybdopterin-dependent oxidoreductase, partial [Ktedonobacteraceae bacterium]
MTATKISYATCPLCEATCGLEIETRDREIISIRGDAQDVFSHGYLCPKAYSLKELHADPDCIRGPMVRRDDQWISVSWDEAFAEIESGLMPILQEYGRDALAVYVGNPNAHNIASLLYLPAFLQSAKTHNFFSASTV